VRSARGCHRAVRPSARAGNRSISSAATRDFGARAGDSAFTAPVDLLRARGEPYRKWWAAHDVCPQGAGRKRMLHPRHDVPTAEYATLQSNDERRLKLVAHLVDRASTTA
jgi:hypothetical protein